MPAGSDKSVVDRVWTAATENKKYREGMTEIDILKAKGVIKQKAGFLMYYALGEYLRG